MYRTKKTVNDNIQLAIAYEERTIRQQSFDNMEKFKVKTESTEINNMNQTAKRWEPAKKCFVAKEFSPHNI